MRSFLKSCNNQYCERGAAMRDSYSKAFINALKSKDILKIKEIPKADLHNHFVLGGNREYISNITGVEIPYFNGVLAAMQDMHDWNDRYIGKKFNLLY